MKPPGLPVFTLESFPQNRPHRPWYLERLERHVANFPGISQPHAHDFYLLYVTQGHGTHTIDLVAYELQPGSLFFMVPGQVHHWQLSDDAQGYVVFFEADFYLFRYPGPRLYEYPFFTAAHSPVLHLGPDDTAIRPLMERMWAEDTGLALQQDEVFRSYLHICLELAARHYAAPAATAPDEPRHAQQLLREFGLLLNQHFRAQRTVQHYADLLHVSPNHLNALCRRQLGKTASTLIQERVLVEARRLLRHTNATVGQVADALGFEDASYFGRYFRKHTGQTPGEVKG